MRELKHGLYFGIERCGKQFYIGLKAIGTLNHQDYEIMTPMIEAALAQVKTPKINLLFDGSEFDGWELRAAWDDIQLGLRHGHEFNKIALYGHQRWLNYASKVAHWFVSGEVCFFENIDQAILWLQQK